MNIIISTTSSRRNEDSKESDVSKDQSAKNARNGFMIICHQLHDTVADWTLDSSETSES